MTNALKKITTYLLASLLVWTPTLGSAAPNHSAHHQSSEKRYIFPTSPIPLEYEEELPSSSSNTYHDVPLLGDSNSGAYSIADEYNLGQHWLAQLRKTTPLLYDPLTLNYIENLVKKLAQHNDQLQEYRFSLVLINSPQLNAFAAPGGIIGINSGLFHHAKNEGEFAAVVAHEIAHLSQRHFARRQEKGGLSQGGQLLVFLASILLITSGAAGDAVQAGLLGASSLVVDRQLAFSRSNEEEADRIGYDTFVRSKYAPVGMVGLFQRMAEQNNNANVIEYLSTHPAPLNRMASFEARASLDKAGGIINTPMYQLLQVRLKALTDDLQIQDSRNLEQTIKRYESQKYFDTKLLLAYYNLANQYKLSGDLEKAFYTYQRGLSKLSTSSPAYQLFLIEQAELSINLKRIQEMIPKVRRLYELSAQSYPIAFALAKLYQASGDYEESDFVLRELRMTRPLDPLVWKELSENSLKLQDNASYHRSIAEYYALLSDTGLAVEHLTTALDAIHPSDWTLRAAIEERIANLTNQKAPRL